jgi:uncharacterized protein YbjT (DUF2867 family)
MPRVLIVGCGCRGQELARELVAAGHVVRGTTRDPANAAAIAAAGAQPYVGDPDRIVTLMASLEAVTVAVWLLGTSDARELHDGRLRMFCEKTVDTPVRGILYEASPVHPGGRAVVEMAADVWRIPIEIAEAGAATAELAAAVERLIAER